MTDSPARPKTLLAARGLFLLAPLVGEFLLGNMPITWLWALIVLAPLYGGGALLVRETALRLGAGWPGIFLLGLAYGVVEEAYVDMSLFNPNFLGLRLLDYGYVPALGMGAGGRSSSSGCTRSGAPPPRSGWPRRCGRTLPAGPG